MKTRAFLLCWLLFPAAGAAETVDYVRDIKPIFTRHCVSCHGPQKQRSSLRLDTAGGALLGGNAGPSLVPGKSAASRLFQAVTGANPEVAAMPPKGPRLSADEIKRLQDWIDQGAKAPASELVQQGADKSSHWAFQPPRRYPPPAVKDAAWVRNPIDRFILARLEKEGIQPSPEADPLTLLRRVSLDLTGLPPTPQDVQAFLADRRPGSYERQVDRLLASPHYGERWGRHWLDQARYADSNGFNIDAPRSIWKYRDWVIDALNRDLPFDQFTIEQLAGDLLPKATPEQKVATGFHRNTLINQEGGIDLEQFRVESVVDRVNTTGAVFLGLTVGCAQCHDHKYDPISQREFYQLFAFFNSADEPTLELPTPEQVRRRRQIQERVAGIMRPLARIDTTSDEKQLAWEKGLSHEERLKLPPAILAILEVPPVQRTSVQVQLLSKTYREADRVRHLFGGLAHPTPLPAAAHAHAWLVRVRVDGEIARLKKNEPRVVSTLVMQELARPRESYVHLGGDFLRKGAAVAPNVPAVLPALPKKTQANRLDLARWLVDPTNPLTARVTLNRYWQAYFGAGLVETENDFGTQGTPPTHPELLDWLATEFAARQWSMKAMHRLLVTSAAYRQSSRARPDLALKDPRNKLLARQTRLRLEGEVVRDVTLAASGLLAPQVGGASVFPPQPDGVYRFTQLDKEWKPSAGADRYRRGLYTHFWRSAPYPALTVFDAPDSTTTCTRRSRSNTPLQALTLLNDEAYFECAEALAARVVREAKPTGADRLRHAFQLCLSRPPSAREAQRLTELLRGRKGDAEAWTTVARVLLNLDEFITRE